MSRHDLHDDEKLLNLYRRHELTLVPKLFEIFALLFIPWFFGIKYNIAFSSAIYTRIFVGWTAIIVLIGLRFFLIWLINVYLITDQRLLYIYHPRLFKKIVNETPLDRILNVSFRTTGFFSTIFGYGDVLVQVVGLDKPLVFEDIPHPEKVKDFIWKIHHEFGSLQKITYTKPEIAPADEDIIYAPHVQQRLVKRNKDENV